MFVLKMQHTDVVWQKTWHKWVTCTEDGKKRRNDVAGEKRLLIVLLEAYRLSTNEANIYFKSTDDLSGGGGT